MEYTTVMTYSPIKKVMFLKDFLFFVQESLIQEAKGIREIHLLFFFF